MYPPPPPAAAANMVVVFVDDLLALKEHIGFLEKIIQYKDDIINIQNKILEVKTTGTEPRQMN